MSRPAANFRQAVFNDRARHDTMRASFPAYSPVAIPDTTMPEADLLQACLDELDGVDEFLARSELAEQHAPVLLGRPGVASSLATLIARTEDSEPNAPLDLFGVLAERAQLDAENRGRFGEPFLAEARGAIDTLAAGGDLPDHAALGLARAFVRAGLEAPECLFPIFAGEPGTGQALAAFPGFLDQEIDRLARHAGGDDHLLHDLLDNLMTVLPSEFRPTFVQHVSGRDEQRYGHAALDWLLDRSPEIRLAAASGLSGRVRRDAVEPALPALVPLIRNWMPEDSARPLLDTALREARLRGRFHPMARPEGRPTRFLAALPDGSGMQHLAAALELADGPACAVAVVKAGQGVTIVHILRDDGALNTVSNLEDELGALDVPFEAFETALSAALADGLAEGRPPPARLIDVATVCGLSELRPRAMTAPDWLAELDPGGAIAGLPDAERDRLIRSSTAWPNDRPILDTWFEGTALLDESLKDADGPRQTLDAFRARLEERRGDWALLVLRAAHVLKAAGDADWRSFAAVASALLDGCALKGIPIMDHVFLATVDAWHEEERRLRAGDAGHPDPLAALAAAAAWPERDLDCAASLAWLDGYVAAAVLAPREPRHAEWLHALADGVRAIGGDATREFLRSASERHNEFDLGIGDSGFAAGALAGFGDDELTAWAQGFAQGVRILDDDWLRDELEIEDYPVLSMLTALAGGEPPHATTRADLPIFFERRMRMRIPSLNLPDEA